MNTPFKGQIDWLPDFIGEELMKQQELQGYKRDISVFEKNIAFGFCWGETEQGADFWSRVLIEKDINLFLALFKPELEVFDDEDEKYIARVICYADYTKYKFMLEKEIAIGDYEIVWNLQK